MMKPKVDKDNWTLWVFVTLLFAFLIYWFAFDFLRWVQFDSPSYVGASRLMFGLEDGYNFQSRIAKPLVLLFPGLMEWVFGLNPNISFIIQNTMLFFATAWLMFKVLFLIFKDERLAFLGFLAFIMCQPFAIFSLMVLSDIAGWFFIVLGIYLSLKYLEKSSVRRIVLYSLILSIGLFAKESAIIGMIFFGSVLVLCSEPFKNKIKQLGIAFLTYVLPAVLLMMLIEAITGESMIGRVGDAQDSTGGLDFKFSSLWQLYRIIDVFWMIIGLGMIRFVLGNVTENKLIYKASLMALGVSFIMMPVWPYFVDRVLFMIAPLLMVFLVNGLKYFRPVFQWMLIFTGGGISILTAWFIYHEGVSGLLERGILAYGILTLIALFLSKRKAKAKVSQ